MSHSLTLVHFLFGLSTFIVEDTFIKNIEEDRPLSFVHFRLDPKELGTILK